MNESSRADARSEKALPGLKTPLLLLACAIALLLISLAFAPAGRSGAFQSHEVRFTDASTGGLAIVPASCPSNPGDADAPNGCGGPQTIYPLCPDGSLAPNGNVDACGGSYINGPSPFCPSGYVMQNGECVPAAGGATCPNGYQLVSGQCVNTQSNCPVGFSKVNASCVFTGCPSGYSYSQQEQACIIQQCASAYICGADGNQYLEGSDCQATLVQQCSWGCFQGACLGAPTPTATIVATPALLKSGNTANVSWTAVDVQSCTVTGTNGDGQGWGCKGAACSATSTQISSPIQSQTIYTLACTGLDGSQFSRSATVNIIPVFKEK